MSKVTSLETNRLLSRLAPARSVLVAGAGGGFDIYGGIPIISWLLARGKNVVIANLTFTNLGLVEEPWITPCLKSVTKDSTGPTYYFPEKYLAQWFSLAGLPQARQHIYCFDKTGVEPLSQAYELVCERHEVDAVLLVDGGTDSLMRGDEAGLGTPHEDMLSIAAAASVTAPIKTLACIGFGVDAFHGVCHAHYLEGVAELSTESGFLGAFSLLSDMPEAQAYMGAVEFACSQMPHHPSIVNTSIVSALEGKYGDYHRTHRTSGSTLWINPLMCLYWAFDLEAVAKRVMYMEHLKTTRSFDEVAVVIARFRRQLDGIRPRQKIQV